MLQNVTSYVSLEQSLTTTQLPFDGVRLSQQIFRPSPCSLITVAPSIARIRPRPPSCSAMIFAMVIWLPSSFVASVAFDVGTMTHFFFWSSFFFERAFFFFA